MKSAWKTNITSVEQDPLEALLIEWKRTKIMSNTLSQAGSEA